MLNLWEELPDALVVDGKSYLLHTDFRRWVQIESIIFEKDLPFLNKISRVLSLAFQTLPPSFDVALSGLVMFYTGGSGDKKVLTQSQPVRRSYSFSQDAAFIYAAFMQEYGLDLYKEEMHWWQFCALFRGLSDRTRFVKIAGYRMMNTADIQDAGYKQFVNHMKALYALPDLRTEEEKEEMLATSLETLF